MLSAETARQLVEQKLARVALPEGEIVVMAVELPRAPVGPEFTEADTLETYTEKLIQQRPLRSSSDLTQQTHSDRCRAVSDGV